MREMEEKKISNSRIIRGLTLIFLLATVFASALINVGTAQVTRLYVDPPSIFDITMLPSPPNYPKFNVTINIENVTDLFTWSLILSWDPAVLNVTDVVFGSFLADYAPEGTFRIKKIYQELGYIDVAESILGPYPGAGVEDSGILLYVTFLVEKAGGTYLDLKSTDLLNSKSPPGPISHTVNDGYFANLPPRIYVDPTVSSAKPGKNFTLNIAVNYMPDLHNWSWSLAWNASVLDVLSVKEGPFLKSGNTSTTFASAIDSFVNTTGTYGRINASCTRPVGVFGVDGKGILANVTFTVKPAAATTRAALPLDLYDTKLFNSTLNEITHETFDGEFFASTGIYTDPGRNTEELGKEFTINVKVFNVLDLFSWELRLNWSATVLQATKVKQGLFLGTPGTTTFYYSINNTAGSIYANSTLLSPPGVNGTGTLTSITFFVKEVGATTLDLNNTKLFNSTLNEITHIVIDGSFSYFYPNVDFDITTPQELRLVNNAIAFDAPNDKTNDTDGFITSYWWNFGDGNNATVYPPTTSTTHNYTLVGRYNVTLIATDNDGWTGNKTKEINILKISSTITISVSRKTLTYSENITISGSILPERTQAPVTIWYRRTGQTSWTNMTTTNTNTTSQYNHAWTPPAAVTFEVQANWTGDPITNSSESSIVKDITVNKASSTIYINLSKDTIKKGESVVISGTILSGTLSQKRPNVQVQIQYTPPGGFWRSLTTVTTDQNGNYTYPYTPESSGVYHFKASWGGDANTLESETLSITLNVQEEAQPPLNIALYAAIGIGIIILLATVVLVLRRRRQSQTPQT